MLHADQEGERVNEINTVARNRLVDIEEGGKKKRDTQRKKEWMKRKA